MLLGIVFHLVMSRSSYLCNVTTEILFVKLFEEKVSASAVPACACMRGGGGAERGMGGSG
jgi:hypothetical protein